MKKDWAYVENVFLNLAKRSRPRAIGAIAYTTSQLDERKTDPFYMDLFNFLDPLNQAVVDEEAALIAQGGAQKASTKTVDDLLDDLSSDKIEEWDIAVQAAGAAYRKGKPAYIAIFPNDRGPFQSGGKKERIAAVKALGIALTGIVPLAAVKTSVNAYYILLDAARTAQEGQLGNTETDSSDLTDALVAGMEGLWFVLATCMAKYYTAPKTVEPLFALNLIRESEQTEFQRSIKKGGYSNIAKRTLEPTDKIRVKVLTARRVRFFITDEKNDINPTMFKDIDGLEEEVFDVSLAGNVPAAKFIKAFNLDDTIEARIEVELL
ncbi:MAG: hypothetical protein ABIT08_06030 [Bacteroidia bacterium]